MAALLRRAASSLIPLAARCREFSSIVPRSLGSSCSPISAECSSSVLHFRNGLFASCLLPFSTSSANSPLQTAAEILKSATPKESDNAHVDFIKPVNLNLYWRSKDEALEIQVKEQRHDNFSETSLQMRIKFAYGNHLSEKVEFDVALPDGQGQVAIQNAATSVDDFFREYIQVHMDEFKGLIETGELNRKVDSVVKFAKELQEYTKRIKPKVESVDAASTAKWCVTLILETKDEMFEIEIRERSFDERLEISINCMWGHGFCKSMTFEVALLDEQGQIATRDFTLSIAGSSESIHGVYFDEFAGMLKESGLNDSNLDFMVKYAKEMEESMKSAVQNGNKLSLDNF